MIEKMKLEAMSRLCMLKQFEAAGALLKDEIKMVDGGRLVPMDDVAVECCCMMSKQGRVPYLVRKYFENDQTLYAILYVSVDEKDWCIERPDMDSTVAAYIYNPAYAYNSDFGDVKFAA